MKTEPDEFGISDLQKAGAKGAPWDGVRNYQARNFMREMKCGDQVLIYHSSCKVIGVAGLGEIIQEATTDESAHNPKSDYYDAKSNPANPRWSKVQIKWIKTFKRVIELSELKKYKELTEMKLLQKGSRLSVMPVSPSEFNFIINLV